jgi:mannose-6-phosphate isomerase-like protein (cupin superfamily)
MAAEPLHIDMEYDSNHNKAYRRVIYTTGSMQVVLMNLKPGQEIGNEVHPDNDQFFRFEAGTGKAIVSGVEYKLYNGVVLVVPKGTWHNIINTSLSEPLKLYTIYAPPHHPAGLIQEDKVEE